MARTKLSMSTLADILATWFVPIQFLREKAFCVPPRDSTELYIYQGWRGCKIDWPLIHTFKFSICSSGTPLLTISWFPPLSSSLAFSPFSEWITKESMWRLWRNFSWANLSLFSPSPHSYFCLQEPLHRFAEWLSTHSACPHLAHIVSWVFFTMLNQLHSDIHFADFENSL